MAPPYLSQLLSEYHPVRTLRSSEDNLLSVPRAQLKQYGERSFSVAGPMLWNKLPLSVKTAPTLEIFRSRLKTHLFQVTYSL